MVFDCFTLKAPLMRWLGHIRVYKDIYISYRGCFYYTGINTSGTNSKHRDFIWLDIIIRIQPIPTKMLLIPNQIICFGVHISFSFEISTAGVNTRVIRAPPVYNYIKYIFINNIIIYKIYTYLSNIK